MSLETHTFSTRLSYITSSSATFNAEGLPSINLTNGTTQNDTEPVDLLRSHLLPSLIFVCILLPIGLAGNILTCCVYQNKWRKRKSVTTLFILSLSWIDLVNCLVTMPFEISLLLNQTSFDKPVLCKISRWMTFNLNCFSSLILIGIAVDRLCGIRYPLKRKLIGIHKTKIYIVFSFFIAVLTTWPALVLFGTLTQRHNGHITKTCQISDYYITNNRAIKPLAHGIYLIISSIAVDLVFIFIYSWIGFTIWRLRMRKSNYIVGTSMSVKESLIFYCQKESQTRNEDQLPDVDENLDDDVFIENANKWEVNKNSIYKVSDKKKRNSCSMITQHEEKSGHVNFKLFLHAKHNHSNLQDSSIIRYKQILTTSRHSKRMSRLSADSHRKSIFPSSPLKQRTRSESYVCDAIGIPRSQTTRITFMFFIVTLMYILTFLPYCVIAIIRYSHPGHLQNLSVLEKNIYQLFLRSYLLNMSLNSIIYSFVNKHFRNECISILKSGLRFVKRRLAEDTDTGGVNKKLYTL